jgi:putative oxidoreductase
MEQLNMNDTCKTSDPGLNGRFAFLNRASLTSWAPIPLRVIVGYGFMQHGYAKVVKGPEAFAVILHAIGVPAPHFMAWLTILIELFGGLAVLLGAFIPLASLPMAGVLLVAMFSVHLPYGFSSIKIVRWSPVVPSSGLPATSATCFTLLASLRLCSAVRAH